MRSILSKILLWVAGTVALSAAGFVLTTWWLSTSRPPPIDLMERVQAFQLQGAQEALAERGQQGLAEYLERLNQTFDAAHHLVGPDGVDLLDGKDRSAALRDRGPRRKPGGPPGGPHDRPTFSTRPDATGSRLVVELNPRFAPQEFAPYYLWILPVVVGLGYALSLHFARPLKGLHRSMERFGRGELSTRTNSLRRDEIGELSRAFDAMAERIETLMVSQRRLLQDVSHELRSPLARLALAVRLARTSADKAAGLDRIKREADRLAELVEELLELTTAEGDPQQRKEETLRLDELVERLADDCALEAEAKGCRVETGGNVPVQVRGNGRLLGRAIDNVLRNAVAHAPEGTAIEVSQGADSGRAWVEIRDHGGGVPEAELEAIFEPFFRAETDRSRESGGVGLGLAIARRAVTLHGGMIRAENAGPGLRVRIELPASAAPAP